jgi:hypothetical protein
VLLASNDDYPVLLHVERGRSVLDGLADELGKLLVGQGRLVRKNVVRSSVLSISTVPLRTNKGNGLTSMSSK